MSDNSSACGNATLGSQIRRIREARGWTLAELASRAGTSAPALHRYESGWDRFQVATLRKIAAALGARLEIRLVPAQRDRRSSRPPIRSRLVKLLSPLFWDRKLIEQDLDDHRDWVIGRVLMFGNRDQVAAARRSFGDEALRRAIRRRGIDARTRNYWEVILGGTRPAPTKRRRGASSGH